MKDVDDQVGAGAHVLDVNMGVPLTDEADLLARAIPLVQEHTDLPICIDSSVVEALEAGLAVYEGKALVNSVTCEDDRLERVLPLVKEHGAAVICLDERRDGHPADSRRAARGLRGGSSTSCTASFEIPLEDIVIDPLAMTVGADPQAVVVTLETIGRIREEFGLNMTLGASNISFGLPGRHALNAAFLVARVVARASRARSWTRAPPRRSTPAVRPTCCSPATSGARAGSRPTGRPRRRPRRERERGALLQPGKATTRRPHRAGSRCDSSRRGRLFGSRPA